MTDTATYTATLADVRHLLPSLDDDVDLAILLHSTWVTARVLTRSGNRMTIIKRPVQGGRYGYRVTVVFDNGSAPVTGDDLGLTLNGCLLVVADHARQYRSTPVIRCVVTEN